jgi:hypothetical protein
VWKISPPTGFDSADCPGRSESLYRLRYPGSQRTRITIKKQDVEEMDRNRKIQTGKTMDGKMENVGKRKRTGT